MKYPHYRVVTDQITGENLELRIAFCDPGLMIENESTDGSVYKNTTLLEVIKKGNVMISLCKEGCFFELLKRLVEALNAKGGKPRKLITVDFVAVNRFDDNLVMVDAKAMDRVVVLVDQSDRWIYEKFDPVKWVKSYRRPSRVLAVRFLGGVGRRKAFFLYSRSTRSNHALGDLRIEAGKDYYFGFTALMRNIKSDMGREFAASLFSLIPNHPLFKNLKKKWAEKLVGSGHYWLSDGVQFYIPFYQQSKTDSNGT